MRGIQIYNEIGRLRRVLVHRPGNETHNHAEDDFEQVFSLRPWSKRFDVDKALEEHRALIEVFKRHGVEAVSVRDLLVETLETQPDARDELIDGFIAECGPRGHELLDAVRAKVNSASTGSELADIIIGGIHYGETTLFQPKARTLANLAHEAFGEKTLLVNPLSTMFFTRDPATPIGRSILLNHLYWPERNREVNIYRTIFNHHPIFSETPVCDQQRSSFHIEGGDILNLNRNTLMVGISKRTETAAIDTLARDLFWLDRASEIKTIYAIRVPSDGLRIHLDTYISRIDVNKFIIDQDICETAEIYRLSKGAKCGSYSATAIEEGMRDVLSSIIGEPVRLLPCGGDNRSVTESERLGNATAVLALAPGKLCVLEQNRSTNEALYKAGMDLEPVYIEELTKGFGGPNCLCLPLWRSEL